MVLSPNAHVSGPHGFPLTAGHHVRGKGEGEGLCVPAIKGLLPHFLSPLELVFHFLADRVLWEASSGDQRSKRSDVSNRPSRNTPASSDVG